MNSISDYPKFPVTLFVHAAGVALFIVGLYSLGLTFTDIYASVWKFIGAAIFFFGCDELALSGWRSLTRWRSRQPSRA